MRSSHTDRLLRAGIVVLSAVLIFLIYSGIHERIVVAGDTAPEFTVHADNGRTVTLPNFGGKILVLNFWATWCPPCVQETPSLSAFAAAYASKGVVVLGISVDKDEKAYQAFLRKFAPRFLTVRELKLHEDFGTYMYPETYIIDAKGKVIEKLAEPANWMDPRITQMIDALL
jgi:cytochrome c biogenesis protein CcmG, thiol:disulfide interchange protein DsbE